MTSPNAAAVEGVERERLALEWARMQNFTSVAARHAKDCAAAYDRIAADNVRLREALKYYGCHVHNGSHKLCASSIHSKNPCDCGLAEALAGTP